MFTRLSVDNPGTKSQSVWIKGVIVTNGTK